MQDSYIQILQKETEQTIRRLETSEEPTMSKSLAVSLYLDLFRVGFRKAKTGGVLLYISYRTGRDYFLQRD